MRDGPGVQQRQKLDELRALFGDLGVSLVTRQPGRPRGRRATGTFVENAWPRPVMPQLPAAPALADDFGLCVDALGGRLACCRRVTRPCSGGASAKSRQDEPTMPCCWSAGWPADRRAAFVSTLVAVRSADDPEPLIAMGRWEGEILRAPRACRRLRLRPADVHPGARTGGRD